MHSNSLTLSRSNIVTFTVIFQCLIWSYSFSQEEHRSVSAYYNITQAFYDEHCVNIVYNFIKRQSIGFGIGKVFYNGSYNPLPLSPTQNDWPGSVYNGFSGRILYGYNLKDGDVIEIQVGPQISYQNLYYNNLTFWDGGDSHVEYTRSERTSIFGLDGVTDFKIKLNISSAVTLIGNPYINVSFRYRHRKIKNTFVYNWHYDGPSPAPVLGNDVKKQKYL